MYHHTQKKLDQYLNQVICDEKISGAVISVGIGEELIFQSAYGYQQLLPESERMNLDTVFDLASLTKVVSTWPGVMMLVQENKLSLQNRIGDFYSCKLSESVKQITIRDLLTHTSGLSESTFLRQYGNDRDTILFNLLAEETKYPKNKQAVYSNKGFFILGNIIETVSEEKLEDYVTKKIWKPLGMEHTCYNPKTCDNTAATEYIAERNMVKRGVVHDENAEFIGGVSGHAGVFSNAGDLSRFCRMIVSERDGLLDRELIEASFRNYTAGMNENRGLAWKLDCDPIYRNCVIGHLGFSGTSIWIDPQEQLYVVLLTNRIHPSRENMKIADIRMCVKKMIFGK